MVAHLAANGTSCAARWCSLSAHQVLGAHDGAGVGEEGEAERVGGEVGDVGVEAGARARGRHALLHHRARAGPAPRTRGPSCAGGSINPGARGAQCM